MTLRNNILAGFCLCQMFVILGMASVYSQPVTNFPARSKSLAAPWHQRERAIRNRSKPNPSSSTNSIASLHRWEVQGLGAEDMFGYKVAAAGDVNGDGYADLVIAEPGFSNGLGRICVYYGSPTGPGVLPDWTLAGQIKGGFLDTQGCAEGVGDVNGDGFDDLVVLVPVGRESNTNAAETINEVQIFSGSKTGLTTTATWKFTTAQLHAKAIIRAGRAGDINGDGFGDLYVVLAEDGLGPTNKHAIGVLYGSADGPHFIQQSMVELEANDAEDIPAVACAGDVNGDGFDDLIVGEGHWSHPKHMCGRALLFEGSKHGLITQPVWSATYELPVQKDVDEDYEQGFGTSVAGAGDINGDGFDDVIIGAPYADHGDINEGLVFVYLGSRTGLSRRANWFTESNQADAWLGIAVSGAGDVNGDGFADVLMGAPQASDGQQQEGAVLAFLGSKHGLGHSPHWSVESDRNAEMLGQSLAGVGDVNGDGYDDILIGSRGYSELEQKNIGRALLYYGSPAGLTGSFNWRINKPLLVATQQWLDHTNKTWPLIAVATLILMSGGLLIGWRRALVRQRFAEQENARTQERDRIARDIHDNLGARINQVLLWTANSKRAESRSQADAALEQVNESAQSAMTIMRELMQNVATTTSSLDGLASELADVVQQRLMPMGIKLTVDIADPLPEVQISREAVANIRAIVSEALHNVVQHAQAREVRFGLLCRDGLLELTVRDDGHGFDSRTKENTSTSSGKGRGMRNLRTRAASLGGELNIESKPAKGTLLTFTLPLARLRPHD